MIVNEDGGVTGSIDISKLDEIKPKTDEAKAQLDALKAEVQAGRTQTEADARRLAEQAAAANPLVDEVPEDNRDIQGKSVPPGTLDSRKAAEDKPAARRKES